MLDDGVVFLDLETTGATAHHDRITEIGLVELSAQGEVEEWSTLVNPGVRIPPYIETLTGITNDMVQDAPTFEGLSDALFRRLQGKLLVAHNARFDYGFLRNEFARIGLTYRSRVLCTVKLSRKLYPQERRHNLDSIIERHGLACEQRHRALADARVLYHFTKQVRLAFGDDAVTAVTHDLLKAPTIPSGVDPNIIDQLPETAGVYAFFGEGNVALYVGKSVNIRSRVMSHFSGDYRVGKDMRIAQEVTRVEWHETAGELGALLREAALVKQLTPIHNRMLRRNDDLCTLYWDAAASAPPKVLSACDIDFAMTQYLYGLFRSKTAATNALREIVEANSLCPRVAGLERAGRGPCFSHQLKKCFGACCGKETPIAHALRMQIAMRSLKLKAWPFRGRIGIREHDPVGRRTDIHVVDKWCYLGTLHSQMELFDALETRFNVAFDLDTYKILTKWLLRKHDDVEIIDLPARV